jgi:hypothetical protein
MSLLDLLFNRKRQNIKEDEIANQYDEEADFIDDEEEEKNEEDSSENVTESEEQNETYEVLEREIHPAKIICPDCGGITLEGLEFCDKCGGELQ